MKYGFILQKMKVDDHVFWAAISNDLNGCVGQGETPEEALEELANNEVEWLKTAEEYGIKIPECSIVPEIEYSGKFTVRLSKSAHKKAAECAEREGISLNSFVAEAINEKIGISNSYSQFVPILAKLATESLQIAKISIRDQMSDYYKKSYEVWDRTKGRNIYEN